MRLLLDLVVRPMEDGPGFLAVCPGLQGCHAEGATLGAAIDNVQDVARVILELRREKGLPLPAAATDHDSDLLEGRVAVVIG